MCKLHKMTPTNELKAQSMATLQGFFVPAMSALIATNPEWLPCWLAVSGFFGSLFVFKQEEINELVKFISENPEVFTKEIVETKAFKDGFVVQFEMLLKERIKRKRKVLLNILKGFATEEDKAFFQLERLNNTIFNISLEALEHSVFIYKEVLPETKSDYETSGGKATWGKKSGYSYRESHAIRGLRPYLLSEVNPPNPYYKKSNHANLDDLNPDIYEELLKLGILNRCYSDGYMSEAPNNYYFSDFGFNFLDFVVDDLDVVK